MKKLLVFTAIILIFPLGIITAQEESGTRQFYIEPSYDKQNREKLEAELVEETDSLIYYVDQSWWDEISEREQRNYKEDMEDLSEEFDERIYPEMTENFGEVPTHPVSDKEKISILIHPMRENAGGYFNSGDQYSKYQNPRSNELTLLYLNTTVLDYKDKGGFLAHEFMHLLVFNQKERLRGEREEVWLNEARAEFMPTFLGYDDQENSNLDRRIETFLRDPDISLTEWIGQRADYGVVNIFTQYIVDHYGVDILIDSLKHDQVGIKSINHALEEGGYEEDFHDVFNNFKIAVLKNDCELGDKYCFKSEKLEDLQVSPATNYMPYSEDSNLSVQYRTKNWAGNWHKITGGRGTLNLKFNIKNDIRVDIPYLLCDSQDQCKVDFLDVEDGEGSLEVEDFNDEYTSLTIMPSIQEKISGFNGAEESYLFTWEASVTPVNEYKETLEKLNRLRELLERLRERMEEREGSPNTCTIRGPLYLGSPDRSSVECLQRFLSTKPNIYPEGYVTGNFGSLTKQAVIRFQEKHAEEILEPLNLEQGTGYVGASTISKINNLR
ncbi:MAG: hypothetical protein ACQEP3_02500 [Patescibacteria group bacterium]